MRLEKLTLLCKRIVFSVLAISPPLLLYVSLLGNAIIRGVGGDADFALIKRFWQLEKLLHRK